MQEARVTGQSGGNGNGHSLTEQISEAAQTSAAAVSEQAHHLADRAQEIGADALDGVEEYLRPVGLSLKEHPVLTLAVLGGAAAILGAIWMSRGQRSTTQQMLAQLKRQARW